MERIYDGSRSVIEELYARYHSFDLVVDSRRLDRPARSLFFALPGKRTHGLDFIPELIARGGRHFVVSREAVRPIKEGGDGAWSETEYSAQPVRVPATLLERQDLQFIVAEDPLILLQDLAAWHRRQFDLPVLAITGSNGKTIVKDWLKEVIGEDLRVCASPRSYNSQIGVPLSVWQLRPDHQLAIFEAGVSEAGEMERLAAIIRPTAGVFTNLGEAHAEGFRSREHKLREKCTLFHGTEWVMTGSRDPLVHRVIRDVSSSLKVLGEGATETLDFPADWPPVYRQNAALVAMVARFFLGNSASLTERLSRLRPLANRLELRRGRDGGPVINDTYSNDLSALAAALEFAGQQDPFGRLTLILGALQATGNDDRSALETLLRGKVHRLLAVGKETREITEGFPEVEYFASVAELLGELPRLSFAGQTTLVKGASRQMMDRVADALSLSRHRTLLRLDLRALQDNLHAYRRGLPPETKIMAMVKASAYGGGALPVARAVEGHGADYLAVAYPEEGRQLREGGVGLPIMVLNAEPHTFGLLKAYGLEPVVHDLNGIRRCREYQLPGHLEIDTGMGRLGFPVGEVPRLAGALRSMSAPPEILSVFTHLAVSESPEEDDFTRQQIARFGAAFAAISDTLPVVPMRHVLNTNGISRFPEAAFEMVRLGIGLYGLGDAQRRGSLRPAFRFSTRITAVYERAAGETVGYGRRGKLLRDSRIAVLSVGYADGLPRLAGEGRFSVRIGAGLAPTVGSVCMDMTTVDVTDLPGVEVGEEVVIFGPEHDIEVLATAAQTIPYEILTGIGERVHRLYVTE
ncbi:alanine racemase [Lewinella sp. W8]|uniref:alanine racemase n=1 Tax=Lewinella sp. W8 TaxID=2528208 RepID=UPI001563D8D3